MSGKQAPRLFRILLVGLPLSLVALGVLAMVHYFRQGITLPEGLRPTGIMRRSISREELEACVETLSMTIGERHLGKGRSLEIAAKYIESSLGVSNMGYRVNRQRFSPGEGLECSNLEVEVPGSGRREEIVVVGAHYDTVPGSPGADDNATGVAALLALANAFVGSENARTLRFVAFANEEPPWFQTEGMGSFRYAERCRERRENIVAMLCLESLGFFDDADGSQNYPPGSEAGYPSTANFIALVSNEASADLLEEVSRAFERKSGIPFEAGTFSPDLPGVSWSDHWSFWQAGYPAVMITDTAPFRYPHYHEAGDTLDKVDFARLLEVVRGLEEAVRSLANPR